MIDKPRPNGKIEMIENPRASAARSRLALLLALAALLVPAYAAAGQGAASESSAASVRASGWKACKNLPPLTWKLTVRVVGCRWARRFAHRAHNKFCRKIECSRVGIGESVRGTVRVRAWRCRVMHYHEGFTARCVEGRRGLYMSYGA